MTLAYEGIAKEREHRTAMLLREREKRERENQGRINTRATRITGGEKGGGEQVEQREGRSQATWATWARWKRLERETAYNAGRRSQSGRNAITLTRNPITYSFA